MMDCIDMLDTISQPTSYTPPSHYPSKLWKLVSPYWRSSDWKAAWILTVAIVTLNLAIVGMSVAFNYWNNDFYNALQNKDFAVFKYQLGKFTLLAFAWIILQVYYLYLQQMLMIRWRRWMTEHCVGKWLQHRTYYLLQLKNYATDNPEQRIEQDIDQFTQQTINISMNLLNAIVSFFSFVFILWTLSGPLAFSLFGTHIIIPGYMLWAAVIYSLIGSVLTYFIGRPLIKTSYYLQRYNATFRYSMTRVRENAESIAFYGGESEEGRRISASFKDIWMNWFVYMKQTKRVTWFTSFFGQAAIIFPLIAAAPRYFSGAIQLGGLMQINSAFGQVQGALSWFVGAFTGSDALSGIAGWKATLDRLIIFSESLQQAEIDAKVMDRLSAHEAVREAFKIDDLKIDLPDGSTLLNPINMEIGQGKRVLLSGPSGSGKTTLFRALAGLWPFGRGQVQLPKTGTTLFLPQKPYLPIATLREALTFPLGPEQISDDDVKSALKDVDLEQLSTRLNDVDNWSMILSGGEQQRVAIARAILTKPSWLFLDEATSALETASARKMYQLLLKHLPMASIISIAHGDNLAQYHQSKLSIDPLRKEVVLSALEA